MPRWRALVDRVPPADLIDLIAGESASAWELRGPRLVQARENVKKFRGLVRRIQNRGYATLGRIADHLDRLSMGDESNAAIDAVNAVNLMTVHASKGLEFPIVFVVNLAKGTGGGGAAVRVVADDGHGEPAVSIGALRFEADEEEKLRDREETKRLLYVALTRARDRLYLASALTADGVFRAMNGSLGEVLPPSLRSVFEVGAAPGADAVLRWTSSRGEVHPLRRCAPAPAAGSAALACGPEPPQRPVMIAPVAAMPALPVATVRALVHPLGDPVARRWDDGDLRHVLAGRVVHRLFQAVGAVHAAAIGDDELTGRALDLVRDAERDATADLDVIVADACRVWRRLVERDDVAALFAGGTAYYEVPFTLLVTEETARASETHAVRGVIDCLVAHPDGRLLVIEVKTGRRAPWHQAQLDLYVQAARALQPTADVGGVLLAE